MVLVEDLLGVGEVEVVLGGDVPGQVEQEVQIIGLHAVLGALRVHPLELADFLGKRFRHLLGPILEFGAGLLAGDVLLVGVGPELLLDLLHLLVQEELALLLLDVGLDPALDVVLEFEHLQFLAEELHHLFDPFLEAFHLQQPCFLLLLRVHVGGDEVDEEPEESMFLMAMAASEGRFGLFWMTSMLISCRLCCSASFSVSDHSSGAYREWRHLGLR